MRLIPRLCGVLLASAGIAGAMAQAPLPLPDWAYVRNPPGFAPPPDDGTPRRVPGSDATYTLTQLRNLFATPVWHPGDTPPLPEVVARGRAPDVRACGVCHRTDGSGGPENANIAGLDAAYLRRQMLEYRSGARRSSLPDNVPARLMIATGRALNDAEIEAAVAYFASLRPRQTIRVVEAAEAPRSIAANFFLNPAPDGGVEPIGQRIIELPDDVASFTLRDSRATFTAYVPPGSVARGRALAEQGVAGQAPCATCHGPALHGSEQGPAIAGRSPTYAVRQFFDFAGGARAGEQSGPMRAIAEALSLDDRIALAAYLGSLTGPASAQPASRRE